MNRNAQIFSIWLCLVFAVCYGASLLFIVGFVPPPSATLTGEELAVIFEANRTGIRIGMVLCLFFPILFMPWSAVMSVHMARVEGRFPIFALMQFAGAAMLVLLFMIAALLWLAMAYRPNIEPATLQIFNDFAWFIFVVAFPQFWMQFFSIGWVFLKDKREKPFLPRWACFYTFMVGLSGAGGTLAPFFKSGPWAWNGIFGFWLPIFLFGSLMAVLFPLMIKGVKQHTPLQEE